MKTQLNHSKTTVPKSSTLNGAKSKQRNQMRMSPNHRDNLAVGTTTSTSPLRQLLAFRVLTRPHFQLPHRVATLRTDARTQSVTREPASKRFKPKASCHSHTLSHVLV
eukprot:4300503-Amphidinium_carterae.1